jgi:hypothetical protein
MLGALWYRIEQAMRTLQPAAGHGVFAAKAEAVPCDPDGDAGRCCVIPARQVCTVGALTAPDEPD